MNILKLTAVGLMTLLVSCNATKNSANQEASADKNGKTATQEKTTAMDTKFANEGYTTGVVKLTNTACTVILEVQKTNIKYDPININNEKYSMYKNQDEIVYFKFRPLRMPPRCDEGQPIEITDIKKREN